MDTDPVQPSRSFDALIDSVRQEAVEKAEEEATRIRAEADKQALHIISTAQASAKDMMDEARIESIRFEASAKGSLKRASRDLLISMESTLIAQLNALLIRDIRQVMSGDRLAEILGKLAENWRRDDQDVTLEALMSPTDIQDFREEAIGSLAKHLQDIVIKPSPTVMGGLCIGIKDDHVHYEFTAETLANWLGQTVEPTLREILREAATETSNKVEAKE